jgi:CheY-like chemotaxis protein
MASYRKFTQPFSLSLTAVKNGPDAAKEIRELGFDVNIIGVTGNVLQEDVDHFIARGANDVIFKPVNLGELDTLWRQNGVHSRHK